MKDKQKKKNWNDWSDARDAWTGDKKKKYKQCDEKEI